MVELSSIAGILLALGLLIFLAYRGLSVLLLAPLCALVAVLASPGTPLLASYTQVFMPALGAFVVSFFPLFLLGAVFGRLMEASGAAAVIAQAIVRALGTRQAIAAVVAACAVLTYGGVSLFVVAFAVHPVAVALFASAGLPRRLIPATIALGAFTFTMTALPGTPAIQNAIPMPYFGTTPFAAPGLGLVGGALMALAGLAWLLWRARRARAAGEGFGAEAAVPGAELAPAPTPAPQVQRLGLGAALSPVVLVIVLNYLLATWWFPSLDTSYLAEARYGATQINALRGLWAVISALALAIVLLLLLWRGAERRQAQPARKAGARPAPRIQGTEILLPALAFRRRRPLIPDPQDPRREAHMSLNNVTPGAKAPQEFNVIIEIPMNGPPVKYEVDHESGALFVDRFMSTAMHYPCNYGFIPQTLADDGDPVDVLVITPVPLQPGTVVTCRPLGMLKMDDEAGGDNKLLAVPVDKKLPIYAAVQKPEDLHPLQLQTIQHFFEHYKDLEKGKWVKVLGWAGKEEAVAEVSSGLANYKNGHG